MNKRIAASAAEAGAAAPAGQAAVAAPAAEQEGAPVADFPPDEFTGIGGEYVRDPDTGIRRRVTPG